MTIRARLAALETVYAHRAPRSAPASYPTWLTDLIDVAHREGRAPADVVAARLGLGPGELRLRLKARTQ
jgi:hypothetical protein